MSIDFYDEYTKEAYCKTLDFLLDKCDMVTFCLPNFGTIFHDSSKNIRDDYNIVKDELERENSEFSEYKANVKELLESLEKYKIDFFIDIDYFGQSSNYEREIYVYKYNKEVAEILKNVVPFFEWRCPNFPEDLNFFSNGKLYLETVAHERDAWLEDTSDETIDFIDSLGINYWVDDYKYIKFFSDYRKTTD